MSVGLPGLLTVVFIVLKLTEVIDWSWVWVLAPAWVSFLLAIGAASFLAYLETSKK